MYDPTLEPLRRPAPVLFPASDRKEILRAIRTAGEIGVPVIVYGAQRAYEAVDVLRDNRATVLVDLDWPRPPRDPDPELQPTLATLRSWEHAPSTPAKLEAAGVRFAFYSGGLTDPKDARARVKRAIDAGLSPDAALRALTLTPAQIFGVADRLGSIETGKIANLVITDGDLFETRTKIRTVVVDGRVFDVFDSAPAVASRAAGRGERADSAAAPSGEPVPMADDRGPYREDPVTLIRNATILTASNGMIEGGDILIRNGKIAAVGKGLDAPRGATVVDATGQVRHPRHHRRALAPRRRRDQRGHDQRQRDGRDQGRARPGRRRHLPRARGRRHRRSTSCTARANPIGGRNAVVKLRWGADGRGADLRGRAARASSSRSARTPKRDRNPRRATPPRAWA